MTPKDTEGVGDNGSPTHLLDDGRTVYRGIGIVLAVVVVIVAAGFAYWWLTRTTTGEIDELINANLQPGATTEEIFAFLDRERIEHPVRSVAPPIFGG